MKSAEELWESIVSYIKNSDNTKKNYITILSSVKSVSISDNELTLEVVNDFVVTIIKTHFAKKIEEALNKEFPGLRYRIIVNAPSRESFISKQANNLWIIQLNGKNIGVYNGIPRIDKNIGNIIIDEDYKSLGIEEMIQNDILALYENDHI